MIGMHSRNAADEAKRAPTAMALTALAAKRGCDPAELETPLYDGVDPDALDAMLGREDANHDVYVGFTLDDNGVQVHGDGTVYIDGERFDPETETFE
jgi:hypothetical protein